MAQEHKDLQQLTEKVKEAISIACVSDADAEAILGEHFEQALEEFRASHSQRQALPSATTDNS